jgi:hypothetical protein
MSSPWCNGSQESFLGSFKVEFGEFGRVETYAELLGEIYQQLFDKSGLSDDRACSKKFTVIHRL